jgi:hypothetical protein
MEIKWVLIERDLFGSERFYSHVGSIRIEKEIVRVGEKIYQLKFAIGSIEHSLIKFDSEYGLIKYLTI